MMKTKEERATFRSALVNRTDGHLASRSGAASVFGKSDPRGPCGSGDPTAAGRGTLRRNRLYFLVVAPVRFCKGWERANEPSRALIDFCRKFPKIKN